jgi:DNA-3-methyladenine glycosylase II
LASAAATYRRLLHEIDGPLEAASFLSLDDATLRAVGFSRQKVSYCRAIAFRQAAGALRLSDLGALDDEAARRRLMAIRGIGPWTADCYLLSALGRPDVWPEGDRALQVAVGRLTGMPGPADVAMMRNVGERWRPYRAVAARLLWLDYLEGSIPPGMG